MLIITAFSLLLSALTLLPTTAASEEPASVVALRSSVLAHPGASQPIREVVDEFASAEGPRLQQLYLVLAVRKEEALPLVLERLDTGSPTEKRKITKLLRHTRWPESVPKLLEVASSEDEHWLARTGCLYALAAIGDSSVGSRLASLLEKSGRSPTEKRVIIATLARLGYREAAAVIEPYLEHEQALVRIFAAGALAELGREIDTNMLIEALQDEDYVIRQEACHALGAVDDPAITAYLEEIARTDINKSVRQAAVITIARIKTIGMSDSEKASSIGGLLSHPDGWVRAWAIRALAGDYGEEGAAVLRNAASRPGPEGRQCARQLLMLSGPSTTDAKGDQP